MATGLKFRILGEEELYKLCSVNKGSDQLICAFVFAYDKRRFSYDAAKKIMLGQASCHSSLLHKYQCHTLLMSMY